MPQVISAGATQTQLIPMQEMPPGAIAAIRNQIISALVKQVAGQLHIPESNLIVRDIRPREDLQMYGLVGVDATGEIWAQTATATQTGYLSMTGDKTLSDQRFCAIFGVRDRGRFYGASGSATLKVAETQAKECVSLIKIAVGGGDRVVWDIAGLRAYQQGQAAYSNVAVIIPQNTTYNISFYKSGSIEAGAMTAPVTQETSYLQLIGVTVEPRGKTISP